ncbi:hypothetical protein M8J76_001663 [Diaphorina citri]|nr:hypothetical protein M8J75_005197 [Diaphorina citri]KAI5729348.1 hypothetical protein M8J76_001663 [Diaphorina citri]
MCLSCFSRFRPRYKRLVDNIFPLSPEEGLVKTNMEKLTFYALSSPEKLDRIGEYLYQRASRDISRRRNGYVVIAMEAMDQLLAACHSQTLNLFVESFLKIVQKLLESLDPDLQILATNSFVRFANIEEDTPSYHRRYDFFVSKFSALCHSNYADVTKRNKLRLAGIRGIQGVIRKTVSDDLVENIWESTHMEKIIPSLLFNMQESGHYQSPADPEPEAEETGKMMNLQEDPPALAETCLRELMSRASFNHVKNVIQPVLIHFDHHALWNPNIFATHVLRMLMYSVQSQYSHLIVNCILAYLNDHHSSPSLIRAKIADALSKIISIAASESIGPTVLEVVHAILMQLKESVVRLPDEDEEEKLYQEALIFALGEFAANLPDYQKTEILVFIISKVLSTTYRESNKSEHTLVQNMFMKSLLMVSGKYTCLHISSAFPLAFLEPLLKILQSNDAEIRLLVNKVIHTLLDRHENLSKLHKPTIHPESLELMIDKPSHTDSVFIKKHGGELYRSICQSLELDNNCVENYEVLYTTLTLLCIELISDDTVVDFIREIALTSTTLSDSQKYNLHALVAALFTLVPLVSPITNIRDYVNKTIAARQEHKTYHLLPELRMHYDVKSSLVPLNETDIYFSETELGEYLKNTELEAMANNGHNSFHHRHSWAENTSVTTLQSSNSDLNTEVDSEPGTPNFVTDSRYEELRFESLKRILTESKGKKAEQDRQRALAEKFKNLTFSELVRQQTMADEDSLQYKLGEILDRLDTGTGQSQSPREPNGKPKYETLFPELFYH